MRSARFSARDAAAAAMGVVLAFLIACSKGTEPDPPPPTVTPAAVAFETQPASGTSAVALSPAVRVRLVAADGQTVTTATNSITLAIASGTGTSGAQLTGALTVSAVNGIATFSNLLIDKAGAGYQLTATASGLTSATSNSFNIAAGAASKLVFAVQPSAVASSTAIAPAVQVSITDAAGNVVSAATNVVSVALFGGTAGAVLSGTNAVAAVNGIATFSNLSVDKSGSGFQLSATATSLVTATSNTFAVSVGAASQVTVTTQPASAVAGQNISLAVTITDAGGNRVTTASNAITAAIASGTGAAGAVLSGTTTVNAIAGIANFTDLKIDRAANGYALVLSATSLTAASSATFNVNPGTAAALKFTSQPSSVPVSLGTQFIVEIVDASGNTVTSATNSVTLTIAAATGTAGAVLGGTLTRAAVAGVATFTGISIDKAGTGYKIAANATGLTAAQSLAFDVTIGAASRLEFVTTPASIAVGAAGSFQVRITDAAANTVATATNAVTVAISGGTGAAGAVLGGTLTVAAVNGVATFSNLTVDRAGAAYKLSATSGSLTGAVSPAFDVLGVAAATFSAQPASTTAGSTISSVTVTLRDATGNVATGSSAAVTLAIASGTGSAGATLSGTTTVNAVNGVATFNTLSIGKAGTGYQLTATATSFAVATSSAFNITAAAAAKLVFTGQPGNANVATGIAPAVTVAILDAFDNQTASTANVTISIGSGTGTGGALLGGTLTVSASGGVATFANLTIDRAGSAYRLSAASGALTAALSNTFDILTTPALSYSVQPVNTVAGAAIATFTVTLRDATGAVATASSDAVSIAIKPGTGDAAATLAGTTTVNAVNGVATFSDVSIAKAGAAYQLFATAASYSSATSTSFNITTGAAAALRFTAQPSTMTSGQGATFDVIVVDAFDNPVSIAWNVSLAIASGTGAVGATLGGTTTLNAAGTGLAHFTGITLDKAASGYLIVATGGPLVPDTTSAITVEAGAPTRLVFATQPTTRNSNVVFSPAIEVEIVDAANNIVTTATNAITLAIADGTGADGATLGGSTTLAAVDGVATFADVSVSLAGVGYVLNATAAGLTGAQSASFDIGTVISVGLAEVIVTPPSASVAVTGTVNLSAVLRDVQGNDTPITPVWASSNPGRASVSAAGVVTGVSVGTVTISATYAGLVGRATITITP